MELCPNDSECILLAMVNTQPEYNQDKLNFLYAAIIGAFTVVVGLLKLSQALTASSRLKANVSAIGCYATKTKTTFDWNDMRVCTFARVPHIRLRGIAPGDFNNLVLPSYNLFPRDIEYCATWPALLGEVGISDNHPFPTVACRTSILPEDIQAAPAFADIHSVCIVAGIAGCNSISLIPSRELDIHGSSCRILFSHHPTLGQTAAYERIDQRGAYKSKTPSLSIVNSFYEALGIFRFGSGFISLLPSPQSWGLLTKSLGH